MNHIPDREGANRKGRGEKEKERERGRGRGRKDLFHVFDECILLFGVLCIQLLERERVKKNSRERKGEYERKEERETEKRSHFDVFA